MKTVLVDKVRPHVSVIRLNRPERLNAMSYELMTHLCQALRDVAADNNCWVRAAIDFEDRNQLLLGNTPRVRNRSKHAKKSC